MNHRVRRARPIFLLSVLLATLALLVGGLTPSAAEAPAPAADDSAAPVAKAVKDQIAASGQSTFWVRFEQRPSLSAAKAAPDWNSRGQAAVAALQANAKDSQAGVRGLLTKRGVDFTPFWVANTIRVTAGADVLNELATQPGVAEITASQTYAIPKPQPATERAKIQAIEWNINRVRAPEVWNGFGTRGEGVVIANIDTGVQFDHPALANAYRGNLGGGAFDHNYNWFDPSNVCGSPSLAPCDNNGHGTHTMGTMAGDDGAGNQIGVAPGVRWMAAKGCETNGCSDFALLSSAEWIMAPTDLTGANPRPDLRPNAVNNSWGGGPGNPWYQEMVRAWTAAGIFPVFSNGNAGPSCGSAGSPGDYPESYAVGAFDINDAIAGFSSRGPSALDGSIKPDISAPGVDVRSSVPGNGYAPNSGTSMAAPHVTAIVALMWSAAPSLVGDIAETRNLLDETAVDKSDLSCGGEAENNNVWGEGTIDAFLAVEASPRGPVGVLEGVVTEAGSGTPVAGARVQVSGPTDRTAITGADGAYRLSLPVGDFDVEVSAFGYETATAQVTVTEGATTTLNVALAAAASHAVSGTVTDDDGEPVAGVTVTILGTPIPAVVTGADGTYSFADVPEGEYEIRAEAGGCLASEVQTVVVDGDETVDFSLDRRSDAAGYTCEHVAAEWIPADNVLPLSGDDAAVPAPLPFPFWFYDQSYDTANVSTNGFLNFLTPDATFSNSAIPSAPPPNAAVYALWDDLYVDGSASVLTTTVGTAPNRRFVVEWRNVAFLADTSQRVSFEIILNENGDIDTQYREIEGTLEQGSSATVGIENATGTDALQYSFGEPVLRTDLGVRYLAPDSGFITGTVTDSGNGSPIAGADVVASQDGTEVRSTTTADDGTYLLRVPLGTYTVEASINGQGTESATVVVDQIDERVVANFELSLATIDVSPEALDVIVPAGETRTRSLTVGNEGEAPLEFEILEQPVAAPEPTGVGAVPGATSSQAPANAPAAAVNPSPLDGGPVLVVMDALPWGSDAVRELLAANDVDHDTATSGQLAGIDLSAYQSVMIPDDQSNAFYANYRAALPQLTTFVENGGFLWVGAAAWGWNGGDLAGTQLPGGATIQQSLQPTNNVADPDHPTMQGVPNPFAGTGASHAIFETLPEGTHVIATGGADTRPSLIEYELGGGRVLGTGQTLEFGYANGQDTRRILENLVPYVTSFVPTGDVTWLSVDPTSGTVAPGASASLAVTIDATGLEPGLYRARVLVNSNDPRTATVAVPVTLIVPAYQVAVDSGATGPFTDGGGDTWTADRRYTTGSWGYTNGRSSILTGYVPIGRTTDDRLYQTARNNPLEYRFDNVPNGVYEVDLRFAEINGRRPGRRYADVILEQTLALPSHDIAGEVGTFNADTHKLLVPVTDGQLNVRFVPRSGFAVPIVNGVRVTHRPDL